MHTDVNPTLNAHRAEKLHSGHYQSPVETYVCPESASTHYSAHNFITPSIIMKILFAIITFAVFVVDSTGMCL